CLYSGFHFMTMAPLIHRLLKYTQNYRFYQIAQSKWIQEAGGTEAMDTIHTGKIRRIAIRILTVVTAGTMACGMMPTAVLAEDTQPESSTLTIQSFSDDYTKTFEVDNGTEKDAIGLPDSLNASVQDTAADPSTDPVDTDIAVTWNCDTYDEVTAADYTFTAAVTDSKYALAEGLTMPTITVTVKAAPESADPNESGDSNDPSNDNQNNNNTRSGEPEGLPKPSINYTVQSEPTSSSWQVDKSKTATELNADNKTTVTLSLPSSDYQAVNADVVFLVDKSQYCNQDSVKTAINKMFDQLIDLQNKNPNARINIGVIRFDGWGIDAIKKEDTSGTYSGLVQLQDGTRDLIQQAMTGSATTGIGGTNTEQPVRMANAMLASDTSENTEKYVVMISDYTGYVYEGTSIIDDVSYDHVPVGSAVTVNTSAKLTPGSFVGTTVNDDYSAPYYSNWSSLYQVYANGELDSSDWSTDQIFFRSANSDYPNTKSQTNWVNYNYSGAYDTQPANKWNVITNEEYIAAAKAITQSVSAAKAKHVTGMQRSLLLTYDALQASLNDGYHLINYRVTDKDPSFTNLQIVTDMLAQIAGN
ncbi:MAG: VWA domain-containing protein, partial [Atopobium sp.]|nr:VWA domain-containing protein [Atopobium sp.]